MTPSSVVGALLLHLPSDVPVDPDADTARRWLEDELADPIYHEPPSLLDAVLRWVSELLEDLRTASGNLDVRTAALVVGAIVVVGAVVALVVAGPVRRARRARASVEVFGDDTRTAAELRAAADALAARGRWSEAVLERFRAVLRSLEERAVLDERPGRTAHEAGVEAGARLPGVAADLARAATLFDDVAYGDAEADADDDAWLRGLDRRVAEERPAPTDVPAATVEVDA
ncbi:DUF4129 domain-containing protein [Cellulomonas carbonis]|nr:DUF4129 domain-containing protein [Cellulomonas carbonis]GGC11555.1 hypothetical protein GCM10010972_26090 [Cellulomonas carbonis]